MWQPLPPVILDEAGNPLEGLKVEKKIKIYNFYSFYLYIYILAWETKVAQTKILKFRNLTRKNNFAENLAFVRISFARDKCKNCRIKCQKGREIINYDIIKLLMLSSVSKEFQKFFFEINCCNLEFSQNFFYSFSRKRF